MESQRWEWGWEHKDRLARYGATRIQVSLAKVEAKGQLRNVRRSSLVALHKEVRD